MIRHPYFDIIGLRHYGGSQLWNYSRPVVGFTEKQFQVYSYLRDMGCHELAKSLAEHWNK